jgi:hypothetical protein
MLIKDKCSKCGEFVPKNEFLAYNGQHENCRMAPMELKGYTPWRVITRRVQTLRRNGLVRRKKVPE